MKKTYNCNIYFAGKAFLYCTVIFILYMAIFAFISITFRSPLICVGAFIIISIVPFFFRASILEFFTKRAFLEFDHQGFSITLRNLKNENDFVTSEYLWGNIKSYKFYFTPSKLTYLDLFFKRGRFKEFGFKDNKTEEESIKQESVFSIFRSYIKEYNATQQDIDKIQFIPGFLTTKKGTFLLVLIGLSLVASGITYMEIQRNFNPIFFLGLFVFLPLLAKRNGDKKFYQRMKD